MKTAVRVSLIAILATVALLTTASPSRAAGPIIVNTLSDTASGGFCTLREAITNANSEDGADHTGGHCTTGTIGQDFIYITAPGTITLNSQLPAITSQMQITGNNGMDSNIIAGQGSTGGFRVFEVSGTGNLLLQELTVQNGYCSSACATQTILGGAIYIASGGYVDIENSRLYNNQARFGGAVYNDGGDLYVAHSIFDTNEAFGYLSGNEQGGAIEHHDGSLTIVDSSFTMNSTFEDSDNTGSGGAVYAACSSTCPRATIKESTFSQNTATRGGAVATNGIDMDILQSTFDSNSGNSSQGGGGGVLIEGGTVSVTDSTFYNNSAYGGGGLKTSSEATTYVVNSTFSENSATFSGLGAGIETDSGTLHLKNNYIANSTASVDCHAGFALGSDINNLIEDNSGCGSPAYTDDLDLLGPLQDNAGPTHTMALLAGNPAVDAGDDTTCGNGWGSASYGSTPYDQRGVNRIRGAHCDIGAYERITAPADFDGNNASNVVVYSGGAWQFYDFATGAYLPGSSVWTGDSGGCIPAPMDYDGDGKVEFTQLCGPVWHFYNDNGSYNKGIWTGLASAVPVPGDYNGDGTDNPVVFDGGAWQRYDFATGAYDGANSVWTGLPGGSGTPVAMDYNGDGIAEPTILDSSGAWHFYSDNGSYNKGIWIGMPSAVPVPGDYNGNGTDQPVVFDAGAWQFFNFAAGVYDAASSVWTGAPAAVGSGVVGPAPLDYNGDQQLDFTYYAGGAWHFFNADGGYNKGIWTGGTAGDEAISRRQMP